jgi:hypothetical protein
VSGDRGSEGVPVITSTGEPKTLAPLLVGVTGKLDLLGADDAVRAALDRAFDRLDARCPTTPKVLLSGLARGADSIAAQAALMRPGWSVVAVLPFSEALFLEDFQGPERERFLSLKASARVRSIELPMLRTSPEGQTVTVADLSRANDGPHPARADHYEQAGLYISERSALMLAVMEAGERPDKIGGTARVVRQRLSGELDEHARDIVRRSSALVDPPRLVDRHAGPVWIVDLATLIEAPSAPDKSLLVWAPGHPGPVAFGGEWATSASLSLADSLEDLNRRADRLSPAYWIALGPRVGPHAGDAASEVRRLRAVISDVQGALMGRVRGSIWQLATISCAAILAFEIYVDGPQRPWAKWFALAYPLFVLAAVMLYWRAARQRWQRLAEDYRAVSEALRVQLVWWSSGLAGAHNRVERYYLRGAHGAFRQLRALIMSVIDGALLRFDEPKPDIDAVEGWAEGQISFFDRRITSRRREMAVVETASWFLFAASLSIAASLALSRFLGNGAGLLRIVAGWPIENRLVCILVAVASASALFLLADRARESAGREGAEATFGTSNTLTACVGLAAGLLLAVALGALATALPGDLVWAQELLAIAVIMAATIAGAIRFVSEKSSWAAELTGYEHARSHFQHGLDELAAVDEPEGKGAAERGEIIVALGAEALSENENWLRSHRERPLEPIVGG